MSEIAISRQSPDRRAILLPVTQLAVKKAAIFFYVIVNGTWVLIVYLLHKVGVPLRAIAFVFGVGVIFGNLAAYAGVKLAAKVLGRPPGHLE